MAAAAAAARENALLRERVAFLEAARQAEIPDDDAMSVGYTPSTVGGRTPFTGQQLTFASPDTTAAGAAASARGGPPPRYRGGETPGGGLKSPAPGGGKLGPSPAGGMLRQSSLRKPLTPLANIREQNAA